MMDKEIVISVIMPVYNSQENLNRALDSIVNQGENYEVILVDDGSTDNSFSICDLYAGKYDNVKALHISNSGPLQARLQGIKVASGKYLMFIDDDDTSVSNAVKTVINCIRNDCPDLIVFNYHRIAHGTEQDVIITDKKDLKKEIINSEKINALWNKCFKKELLNIEYFDHLPRMVIGEDKLIMLEVIDKAEKISFIDECLYCYIIRDKSLSHKFTSTHFKDMIAVSTIAATYADKWGIDKRQNSINKINTGITCLFGYIFRNDYKGFVSLADYVNEDDDYWETFLIVKGNIPFLKKITLQMIRKRRYYLLYKLLRVYVLSK